MSFDAIRDQNVAVALLRNMLTSARVPHGLLFWGPSGVGRQLCAMEFAKAVNCAQQEANACDECLSCRKVTHGNHPDVKILEPVKKSRVIDADSVRSINELASLRAFEATWRVFIILEADRMNERAQNLFLKTLEEPPGRSIFILITEHPGMLLPTIRSRCQRVRFGTLSPDTITDLLLQGHDLEPEHAITIANLAQGQMSRAVDLVQSDKRDIALDITARLGEGEDPLALAEEFAGFVATRKTQIEAAVKAEFSAAEQQGLSREDREDEKQQQFAMTEALVRRDIMEYLYLFATWYRDVGVFAETRDPETVFNRDLVKRIEEAPPADLDAKLDAIEKARLYLERFLNEERVFRDLFFVLAG